MTKDVVESTGAEFEAASPGGLQARIIASEVGSRKGTNHRCPDDCPRPEMALSRSCYDWGGNTGRV